MITWQESYSTGVAELDKQHKQLFQYTNELEDMIKTNAVSKHVLEGAMKYLEKYVSVHFGREETCMFKHQCPIASKNKDAHQKFIEKYHWFAAAVKEQGASDEILLNLHHFLETWLVEHICKIDTQLKPCVHP